jgi:hypothetical protein
VGEWKGVGSVGLVCHDRVAVREDNILVACFSQSTLILNL